MHDRTNCGPQEANEVDALGNAYTVVPSQNTRCTWHATAPAICHDNRKRLSAITEILVGNLHLPHATRNTLELSFSSAMEAFSIFKDFEMCPTDSHSNDILILNICG
ncbi:hypothetical protein PsorP6_000698 [Peronosclerospora sorghi]|uniref:Uncharacterized protein n=1 Tax=Peronosclerospora sorghi TaxID=230839 RepID=A0ACC0WRA8_9STRA|nr:hypothetical protein PsorP6_000698 [Peronosclerospora sorghi]